MNIFPDGARVCFVGDSITHIGLYIKLILANYRAQFAERHVEFYNCGIAGGTLANTLEVYREDIEIYDPTHIVLMIGVNDSKRDRLDDADKASRYECLLEAYEKYKRDLDEMYRLTKERGIELILCTPVPYDEYQTADSPSLRGGYALMQGYAAYVKAFAASHGLELCDYHAAMTKAMQTETLYAPDRVHPNDRGHFFMAKAFLEYQGAELAVSEAFSSDIEEWYGITQKLRNVVAAEYILVKGYTELSCEERMAKIQARLDEARINGSLKDDYVGKLMQGYSELKPHQADYVEYLKKFMKSNNL